MSCSAGSADGAARALGRHSSRRTGGMTWVSTPNAEKFLPFAKKQWAQHSMCCTETMLFCQRVKKLSSLSRGGNCAGISNFLPMREHRCSFFQGWKYGSCCVFAEFPFQLRFCVLLLLLRISTRNQRLSV